MTIPIQTYYGYQIKYDNEISRFFAVGTDLKSRSLNGVRQQIKKAAKFKYSEMPAIDKNGNKYKLGCTDEKNGRVFVTKDGVQVNTWGLALYPDTEEVQQILAKLKEAQAALEKFKIYGK